MTCAECHFPGTQINHKITDLKLFGSRTCKFKRIPAEHSNQALAQKRVFFGDI